MNEADRIAHEKARKRELEAEQAEIAATRKHADQWKNLIDEIENQIPAILQLIEKYQYYDDVEEVQIDVDGTWFQEWWENLTGVFKFRKIRKGGWVAGHYWGANEDESWEIPYYLVSDGTINVGGKTVEFRQKDFRHCVVNPPSSSQILAGLRTLREKVERYGKYKL